MSDDINPIDTNPSPASAPVPKKSNLPKILGFGCGGLLLIGIILFYFIAKTATTVIKESSSQIAAARKTIDSALSAEGNILSINVSRATIQEALPEMKWEIQSDVGGLYVGTASDGGTCQLFGSEESLMSAIYSGPIRSSDPQKKASVLDAVNFINAIDANARPFMDKTFAKGFETGSASESTVIGNRRYTVSVPQSGEKIMAMVSVMHS